MKWFTLRLQENNTTIHLKSFEYIKTFLRTLDEKSLKMSDWEASAFLPSIVIKVVNCYLVDIYFDKTNRYKIISFIH